MIRKSDIVRKAVADGEWKKALHIAKDFQIGINSDQRESMTRAYECMVHPQFYQQLGTNISEAIEIGKQIVAELYG